MADISDAAMSSLDIGGLAERLLERLARVMRADAAALLLAEDGQLRLAASVGFSFGDLVVSVGEGFSGRMASERTSRYLEDAQAEGEVVSEPLREQGIRSALGVPMLVGERLIGTLHVDWRTHHAFDERDVRLLEIVGDRIALAMRNAQLYEGERRIAQIFQEALLSLPEHINGVEYAKAYHSATEEAWVGGDFFDLFPVDSQRVGVLIGDVSGKGIEAAVLTSIVKDTIRAHVHEGSAPAQVLQKTNALVEHYSNSETFVTVFFGVLERATGRFIYCNAGHLPALSLDCRGTVLELSSNSPLLGALPDVEFIDDEVQLPEGQTLLLFTDGLVEARSGAELYD
ncbi:GAF domain-containing protein, partial [bacterium]|nr:GAF domain-containing protein [bacterium]